MKHIYNHETNEEEYICGVCRHRYIYNFDKFRSEGKPFIEFEAPLLCMVEQDWGPDKLEQIKQYACPVCGALQIIV